MADRNDLAVAPGQLYIEVEYDYEYKSKDRMITIKQGERYLLVKKSNEDWWQVRKDESSKPFYLPAQYVREVRRALMPPTKPLLHTGGGVGAREGSEKKFPTSLELKQCDETISKPQLPHTGHPTALHSPKEEKAFPKSPRNQGQQMFPNLQLHTSESSLKLRAPLNLDGQTDREGEREKRREEATASDGEMERKREEGNKRKEEEWVGNRERKRDVTWDRDPVREKIKEEEIGEDKSREQKRGQRCDRDGEKSGDGQRDKRKGERVGDGEKEKKDEGGQPKTATPEDSLRPAIENNRSDLECGDVLSSSSTEQFQVGTFINRKRRTDLQVHCQ